MKLSPEELTDAQIHDVVAGIIDLAPRVLPGDWRLAEEIANARWYRSRDGLVVCLEFEIHSDGSRWLHCSMSRRDRDPSYFDMCRVKELFIGQERKAIQVFPAKSEHYNFHEHCLHLWSCLTSDPLPDLRLSDGAL